MTPTDYGCKCEECPFAKAGKAKDFVLPEGPRSPVGVVFCDVPTIDDSRRGSPMAANSQVGREWDKSLMQAGLARETLLHVPVTACKRPHGARDADVVKAIKACAPMREAAVKLSETTPHIALGQYAWRGLTGKKDHAANRGFVEGFRTATFRPELAYFWAPHEWASFDTDIRRFGRMIRGETEKLPEIVLTGNLTEPVMEMCRRAVKEGWVAFDIETSPVGDGTPWTGKDPTQAKLRTLSFGWPDVGYAFFWDGLPWRAKHAVELLLKDPRVVKVGVNLEWFDRRVCIRHGLLVTPFEDCRDKRRAISSTSRLSLAYLATQYTDAPPWKADKKSKHAEEEAEEAEEGEEE